jgi:hypothetical protein
MTKKWISGTFSHIFVLLPGGVCFPRGKLAIGWIRRLKCSVVDYINLDPVFSECKNR